jgi:hypothetical protein
MKVDLNEDTEIQKEIKLKSWGTKKSNEIKNRSKHLTNRQDHIEDDVSALK